MASWIPLLPLSVAIFGATLSSAGDLKIVTTHNSGAPGIPPIVSTNYYTQSRSRREFRNGEGSAAHPGDKSEFRWGPHQAIVQRCDTKRLYAIDLDAREFTVSDLDEHAHLKGFKPVPTTPEAAKTPGSLEIWIDTVDTGERQDMFGFSARHLVTREKTVATGTCGQSSTSERDGWYIDLDIPTACERTSRKPAVGMAVLLSGTEGCLKNLHVHRTGINETGYPVKLTATSHNAYRDSDGTEKEFTNTSTTEVIELSTAPLDRALFEVPTGFKQVSKLNTQAPVPTMVALEMWWERLKRSIRGLFS
jgi:hypothetical protein